MPPRGTLLRRRPSLQASFNLQRGNILSLSLSFSFSYASFLFFLLLSRTEREDGRTDGGKVKLIINFPRQINKKKRGKMFLFFFLFFCLEDDDDDEKEKMKGNKVQKEKKKGASAWSPRQQIKARWTGHLSAALAGSRIYIYIKIYIIPPLAWFEPVGFFWCPSHGRSTYSNSFSLFRFLLRWQKRIHFLSSWARQRFSCLNALSLCSRNDSTLTHTPRVLLYHTQTIVDFHRLPPSNIVFYFSFICSLTEGKWIYGCNQLVSFRFLMINCLCLVIPISLFRGAFLQVLLFLFSPRLQNDKKNLFQLILPPLWFRFGVCDMMNYDVIHLCVREPTWLQPHTKKGGN